MTNDGLGRQFIVMLVVLALHVLFVIVLLMRNTIQTVARGVIPDHRESVLFFIESSPESPKPAAAPIQGQQPMIVPAQPPVISEPPVGEVGESTGETETNISGAAAPVQSSPTTPANAPPVDWSTQAAHAATAAVDQAIRQDNRKCDPAEKPNSFLPPCNPKRHKFEWNPEEPRVGVSGGLPFIRLGKRCVLGLGFFGCGIGELPPANGELFKDMQNAERDPNSVPAPGDRPPEEH